MCLGPCAPARPRPRERLPGLPQGALPHSAPAHACFTHTCPTLATGHEQAAAEGCAGLPDPRARCPHSFCLCLDGALNREPLETGGPQEGWAGAPRPTPAGSPSGPLKPPDPPAGRPRSGLCVYLGREEAERLGTRGPLHFRYKQARLQALETMANVLKRRIDLLAAKLLGADAPQGLPPSLDAPEPGVPGAGRASPWSWADTRARLLPSPSWEQRRSVSPGARLASPPPGEPLAPPATTYPAGAAEGVGIGGRLLSPGRGCRGRPGNGMGT